MINHPSYISDLLAGANHLHKDDVSEFEVVEVTITVPDGTVKDIEVLWPAPRSSHPAFRSRPETGSMIGDRGSCHLDCP